MKVEKLMTKSPAACSASDTLTEAARLMWENDCGCIPVVEGTGNGGDARLVGMITDRDICMAAYSRGQRLDEIEVGNAMATDVYACRPGDTVEKAEATMRDAQIRRLPVIDDGCLVGILSLADIALVASRQQSSKRREVSEEEVGDTLASICRPHAQTAHAHAPR